MRSLVLCIVYVIFVCTTITLYGLKLWCIITRVCYDSVQAPPLLLTLLSQCMGRPKEEAGLYGIQLSPNYN